MEKLKFPSFTNPNPSPFAGLVGIMPLGLIGRAAIQWNPWTFAGTDDAATAAQRVLDQLHEQMRNTPPRDRRPNRPNTYWQFKSGKIGVPDTFLDLTDMKVYRAWDRSLGAFVSYAA